MTKFDILAAIAVPVRRKKAFVPLAKLALGFAKGMAPAQVVEKPSVAGHQQDP